MKEMKQMFWKGTEDWDTLLSRTRTDKWAISIE